MPTYRSRMSTRRFGLAIATAAAVVLLGACGEDEEATKPSPKDGQAVSIKTFMFRPDPLRVPAGTRLTWTNKDEITHTVTSGIRTYDAQGLTKDLTRAGEFDMKLDGKGSTASFTFEERGTVRYLCTIHPGMDAEVIVT